MAEKPCLWSNRRDPGTRPVTLKPGERHAEETVWVCPAHEEELRGFYAYAARWGNTFLGLVGLVVVAGFGLVLRESSTGVGLLLAGLGAVMLVFPFATPQTVQVIGVRASIRLVRVGGVAMIGFGLYEILRAVLPGR